MIHVSLILPNTAIWSSITVTVRFSSQNFIKIGSFFTEIDNYHASTFILAAGRNVVWLRSRYRLHRFDISEIHILSTHGRVSELLLAVSCQCLPFSGRIAWGPERACPPPKDLVAPRNIWFARACKGPHQSAIPTYHSKHRC